MNNKRVEIKQISNDLKDTKKAAPMKIASVIQT